MDAQRLFISYSHDDVDYRDQLLTHLRPLERRGVLEFWESATIKPGSDWSAEISKAISESKIAILLVSPSFLASDFATTRELPALLERHRTDGLAVLPILVRPTMWTSLPGLAELQFANNPNRPVSAIDAPERDHVYASIAQRVAELAEAVSERESEAEMHGAQPSGISGTRQVRREGEGQHIFVSHCREDGDFAELLKLRLEREGFEAWVDSDRLEPGLDWRVGIDEALKTAAAILAVMSPEARGSEYVTYEWAYAWGCERRVIPIMLKQTTLHPRLAALQYLDFTNRIARPWSRLLEVLPAESRKNRSARPEKRTARR